MAFIAVDVNVDHARHLREGYIFSVVYWWNVFCPVEGEWVSDTLDLYWWQNGFFRVRSAFLGVPNIYTPFFLSLPCVSVWGLICMSLYVLTLVSANVVSLLTRHNQESFIAQIFSLHELEANTIALLKFSFWVSSDLGPRRQFLLFGINGMLAEMKKVVVEQVSEYTFDYPVITWVLVMLNVPVAYIQNMLVHFKFTKV